MADPADRLRAAALTGLESLSSPDTWREYGENIYQSNAQDIEQQNYDRTKAIIENTYGRGLGLSSIAAQMQAERERVRSEALIKARRDAEAAAQQARLAALGQAAGVAQAEMNRRQQAGQFDVNVGQQNKALKQQQSIANTQAMATGLGGLGSAGLQMTGLLFADKLKAAINGGGKPTTPTNGLAGLTIGGDPGSDIAPGGVVNAGAPMTTSPAPTLDFTPSTSTDFGFGSYPSGGGLDMLGSAGGYTYPSEDILPWGSWGGGLDALYDYNALWGRDQNWGWG